MDKILGKRRIDSFFNENENITFDPEMVVEQEYSDDVSINCLKAPVRSKKTSTIF